MKLVVKKQRGLSLSQGEKAQINAYIVELAKHYDDSRVVTVLIHEDEETGNILVDWSATRPQFERIRRITGYLVGSIDRWNDAKRAEEHDRVKHSL